MRTSKASVKMSTILICANSHLCQVLRDNVSIWIYYVVLRAIFSIRIFLHDNFSHIHTYTHNLFNLPSAGEDTLCQTHGVRKCRCVCVCMCVHAYTYIHDSRECRSVAYIKERSSVRPIFHACIAILDAYDASGTRLWKYLALFLSPSLPLPSLSLSLPVLPAANQMRIRRTIKTLTSSAFVFTF